MTLKHNYLNTIGVDYNNFYNKELNQIYILNYEGKDVNGKYHQMDNLYELPYKESARGAVWKEFHNRLTEDDKRRFPDYENIFIRWTDVEESGLTDFFRKVEEYVLECMIDNWAKENDLSINWDSIVLI